MSDRCKSTSYWSRVNRVRGGASGHMVSGGEGLLGVRWRGRLLEKKEIRREGQGDRERELWTASL